VSALFAWARTLATLGLVILPIAKRRGAKGRGVYELAVDVGVAVSFALGVAVSFGVGFAVAFGVAFGVCAAFAFAVGLPSARTVPFSAPCPGGPPCGVKGAEK
jgi:hypothetical protein